MKLKYKFEEKLIEGLIKSRPNRFLMNVEINKKIILCHCPSTGRVGNIIFEDIPCLLSKSANKKRKTPYTVEAISLDPIKKKHKRWIGINQMKMNNYVQFFLENNKFSKMINGKNIQRERKLGNSRIDFLVGKDYLEVKMPLITLPGHNKERKANHSKFDSFDRLIKHLTDLSKSIKDGSKAIVLLTYVYPAEPFMRPKKDSSNSRILTAANKASKKGVENWQANFKIDATGVTLIQYFKLIP